MDFKERMDTYEGAFDDIDPNEICPECGCRKEANEPICDKCKLEIQQAVVNALRPALAPFTTDSIEWLNDNWDGIPMEAIINK